MIWSHLRAVLWLRRRSNRNSIRRHGSFAIFVTRLLKAVILIGSAVMFAASLYAGGALVGKLSDEQIVVLWTLITLAFAASWSFGVLADLQRSDSLSLEKLLHLPISLTTAFFINYLSSFFSLTLVFFLPSMLGLAVAHVRAGGAKMWVLFPLIFSFIGMVTALTFQFRGWLAALMTNKRRQRTILTAITIFIICGAQVPNMANIYWQRVSNQAREESHRARDAELEELKQQLDSDQISVHEFQQRSQTVRDSYREQRKQERREHTASLTKLIASATKWLPLTWTAHGAGAALRGNVWPALLEVGGALLIAIASLGRSYRTTLRYHRGEFSMGNPGSSGDGKDTTRCATSNLSNKPLLVERRLPLTGEPVAAVAVTTFRSLTRAPEAKMGLLSLLIMFVIFGSMSIGGGMPPMPDFARPLLPLGVLMMSAVGVIPIGANLFGLDRQGFRLFVVAPLKKRDILLGKNLATAPLVLPVGWAGVAFLQWLQPLPLSDLVATLVQSFTIVMVSCMVCNLMSILTPSRVASGAIRKGNPTLATALFQFLILLLLPIGIAPTVIPWVVDAGMTFLGWDFGLPVYLLLSIALAIVTAVVYLKVLKYQGALLDEHQHKILTVVTSQSD